MPRTIRLSTILPAPIETVRALLMQPATHVMFSGAAPAVPPASGPRFPQRWTRNLRVRRRGAGAFRSDGRDPRHRSPPPPSGGAWQIRDAAWQARLAIGTTSSRSSGEGRHALPPTRSRSGGLAHALSWGPRAASSTPSVSADGGSWMETGEPDVLPVLCWPSGRQRKGRRVRAARSTVRNHRAARPPLWRPRIDRAPPRRGRDLPRREAPARPTFRGVTCCR